MPDACWIITDGKIGDEIPLLGVAEAMSLSAERKIIAPRKLFAAIAPWGPADSRDFRRLLQPPFPEIAFAAGRRAVPVLRTLKRASPTTFTVFFGDPRTHRHGADLVWAPAHDGLRGDNLIVTQTAPHTRSPAALAAARATPDSRVAALPVPRAAMLIGGPSRHHAFSDDEAETLIAALVAIRLAGFSLAVTTSRRTPATIAETIRETFADDARTFLWSGEGENPYPAMLALADAILVTADSTNMVGEAMATGAPVHVFPVSGGGRRHAAFLDGLIAQKLVRPWDGRLTTERQPPVDATPGVAAAIAARFAAFQQARAQRLAGPPLHP